jgi:D-alanine-D-alanine ligase
MQRAGRTGYNPRMARRKLKHKRCDVAMLVDDETGERDKSGRFVFVSDGPDCMELNIHKSLRARYARVEVVPFGPDVIATLTELKKLRPRIVFNVTEWVAGDRKLDHAIAGSLEIMRFRYTGTGPVGMQLARDKALSKHIVAARGVDVPCCFTVERGERIENPGLPYPLIVKPQFGDGSDEITKASLVRTPRELRKQVRAVHTSLNEAAVCEEFIPGRDIYVGIIGNEPRVLAPIEMVIESKKASAPKFATYRLKNDGYYRTKWRVKYRLARLPRRVLKKISEYGKKAFHALKLRDYARLDFRLSDDGRLVFIEANPNPDLTPHTLGMYLCFAGIEYRHLIPRIVETARKRYRRR